MKHRYAALPPLALFILNLCLAGRLLTIPYLDQMGSIESTHIALSRWTLENWGDLSWFPLWYGGIPFECTYMPLLPRVTAIIAALTGLIPSHAYHAVTAVFYSLGPVTLYALALHLCRSRACSFAAGLFYSLVSTSAFLIPAVRYDVGGLWHARRLQALVQYGEGPHIVSMTLLPLAVLLLALAFEKKKPAWWLAAAVGLASVALTNWLGAAALALAACAWVLARRDGVWWKNWMRAVGVAAFAYVLASPWIPPSMILTIASNEKNVSGPLAAFPVRLTALAVGLAAVAVLLWVFRKLRTPEHMRFSVLFLIPAASIPLTAEWFGIFLAAQPQRYHLEMEMALSLMVAFAAGALLERMSLRRRQVVACLLLLACLYPAVKYWKYAGRQIRPIDITGTIEYREAKWFTQNMPGSRVLAPGSIGFFLNVFTDTPQFAGGFDQGVINQLWTHAQYQILSGENAGDKEGEVAVLWLKAFGVDAVAVSGPRSSEFYKPFRNPRKFDGLLPELWREGDDVIYALPRRSTSLAHVMRPADLAPRRPAGGLDIDPLRPYVAAMDNSAYPVAQMRWRDRHSAVISGLLERNQILSVQISYHPGWKASVGGQPRKVYGDNLGQIVIQPDCRGPCTVELFYSGRP